MRFLSSAKIVYIRITIDNIRRRLGKANSKKSVFLFCIALAFHYICIMNGRTSAV